MSQNNSSRTSLGLLFSTLLHGSVIAFVAIGPSYLKGVMETDNGGAGQNPVEVTVTETSAPTEAVTEAVTPNTAIAAVTVTTPVAVEKPKTPADLNPIRQKAAPVKTVAAAKNTQTKKITPVDFTQPESEVATLPEKENEIQPEPALAVDEESGETETIKENETTAVAAQPSTPEQTQEQVTPNESTQAAAQTAVTNETPAQQEVATAAGVTAATSTANEAPQAGHPEGRSTDANASQALPVTQNYLELKQISGNKPPIYNSDMRLKKLQGRGQLVYFVSKNGEVTDLKLTKSTGSSELDQAAVSAFKKYRFVPGQEGHTVHDFEFVLKGPAEANRARLRTSSN